MFMKYVGRRKNMRDKIESAVLRSLESFEEDFEKGSVALLIRNHAVKITGARLEKRGLGRGLGWMVKHQSVTK